MSKLIEEIGRAICKAHGINRSDHVEKHVKTREQLIDCAFNRVKSFTKKELLKAYMDLYKLSLSKTEIIRNLERR